MTTHTPGPWKFEDDSPGDYTDLRFAIYGELDRAQDGRAYRIAMTTDGNSTARANARLIAAAPELLEALVTLLTVAQDGCMADDEALVRARDMARAALSKATGQAVQK